MASAFVTERSSNQHLTNDLLKRLPVPRQNLNNVVMAVRRYKEALAAHHAQILQSVHVEQLLNRLLIETDAEVLKAYDLPPRLERRLIEFFRGEEGSRPTSHTFEGWIPADFTAYIPLHEYIGPFIGQNIGPWAIDVFTPAPESEVAVFDRYVR